MIKRRVEEMSTYSTVHYNTSRYSTVEYSTIYVDCRGARTAQSDPVHVRGDRIFDLLLLAILQELDGALQPLALVAELAARALRAFVHVHMHTVHCRVHVRVLVDEHVREQYAQSRVELSRGEESRGDCTC